MTGMRLLMAISVVCSASLFAQTKIDPAISSSHVATAGNSLSAPDSETWKILKPSPSLPTTSSNPSPIDHLTDPFLLSRNDGMTVGNGIIDPGMVVPANVAGADSYCLKIRSYVVARDSKNSDSVHPVGYTTCVPATRFRLRTTVIQQNSQR